jgi:nitroreductase
MELYEAMSTLRAVRRLKPDPIPDDVQGRILDAATWAPTGGNVQPWRMVAVTDADKKQALEDLYRPHWEAYIPGSESRMKNMPEKVRASTTRPLEAGT